jgi:mono/diheme cytochrome c family protein
MWMAALITLAMGPAVAFAQPAANPDDVSKGHYLAVMVCSICHVAAPDQERMPMLKPPAPPFAEIAQRADTNAASLTKFISTTHRGLDSPAGMPNPRLADYQVEEVVAYILSLRK